jgi:predicted esterase
MRTLTLTFALATAIVFSIAGPAAAQRRRVPPPPTPEQKQENFSRAFVSGLELLTNRKLKAAEEAFKSCAEIFPERPVAYYNLACTYSLGDRSNEAVDALRECFQRGYRDLAHMARDMDLDPIRKSPAYRRAMSDFAEELKTGTNEALVHEPKGSEPYPVLVWIHDVGANADKDLSELRKVLPTWGLFLPQGAAQNPRGNDSSGEFRVISEVRRLLDTHSRADRRRVFVVGGGVAGSLVVGSAAHNPDLFCAVLASGPGLGNSVSDVDLSGTRAYLVVHKSDPVEVAGGEAARNAFAKAGSAVVLERYPVASPLSKDKAMLLRGVSWLKGNAVTLPGSGKSEAF